MMMRFFLGVNATDSTVLSPASANFLMSFGCMPASASLLTRRGPEMDKSSSISGFCEADGSWDMTSD